MEIVANIESLRALLGSFGSEGWWLSIVSCFQVGVIIVSKVAIVAMSDANRLFGGVHFGRTCAFEAWLPQR